ncbi:peptidoglycan-binding protein [Kutzneria buriramensis]|uniref:peptidoglycan-binding domain-containing protein n=1 Tax=Kutzneria buriramensis TaxID=1045776 RepID=UPI001477103C|nr:peptidoglycan-binding domain-containing protein [Kutzneria buriramensis]
MATVGVAGMAPLVTASPANAAIIPGRCTYTSSEPTLSYAPSTYKVAVKQLQCELNYSLRYTTISVDGYFGNGTRSAVETFQQCDGITADGIVGPQTWSELDYWAASSSYLDC